MRITRRSVVTRRAWDVEAQLRARSEQLKAAEPPKQHEERRSRGTPLGCCHRCAAVVYASDSLAMVAGYLVHDDCAN